MVQSMATAVKIRKAPYRKLLLEKRDELIASVKGEDVLSTSLQTPDAVEFAV